MLDKDAIDEDRLEDDAVFATEFVARRSSPVIGGGTITNRPSALYSRIGTYAPRSCLTRVGALARPRAVY